MNKIKKNYILIGLGKDMFINDNYVQDKFWLYSFLNI